MNHTALTSIRMPVVAGLFYPAQPPVLRETLDGLLAASRIDAASVAHCPKALVVPHAGYIYSGAVAAAAYAQLRPHRTRIRRVVLLGPSHRPGLRGIATSTASAWRTPLGDIPLDRNARQQLASMPQVNSLDAAHATEHSLEVQLPFLQRVLGNFVLLPLVVGEASAHDVALLLECFWYDEQTLFVVSSDLSHYLDYETCQHVDGCTCRSIERLAGDTIAHEHACGHTALQGLLLAARWHHLRPVTLRRCNSGDTAGDRRRVVGYGAWAFYPPQEKAA